jgi:hypothetical protein
MSVSAPVPLRLCQRRGTYAFAGYTGVPVASVLCSGVLLICASCLCRRLLPDADFVCRCRCPSLLHLVPGACAGVCTSSGASAGDPVLLVDPAACASAHAVPSICLCAFFAVPVATASATSMMPVASACARVSVACCLCQCLSLSVSVPVALRLVPCRCLCACAGVRAIAIAPVPLPIPGSCLCAC